VGVRKAGHNLLPTYGLGKTICKNNGEAERLVRCMVVRGILVEETHRPETHLAVISTLAVGGVAWRAVQCPLGWYGLHWPARELCAGGAGEL